MPSKRFGKSTNEWDSNNGPRPVIVNRNRIRNDSLVPHNAIRRWANLSRCLGTTRLDKLEL